MIYNNNMKLSHHALHTTEHADLIITIFNYIPLNSCKIVYTLNFHYKSFWFDYVML